MDQSRFTKETPGRLVLTVEDAWAFVPDDQPRQRLFWAREIIDAIDA